MPQDLFSHIIGENQNLKTQSCLYMSRLIKSQHHSFYWLMMIPRSLFRPWLNEDYDRAVSWLLAHNGIIDGSSVTHFVDGKEFVGYFHFENEEDITAFSLIFPNCINNNDR